MYLCFQVVRLLSSFCLLLWILLKDQREIDIRWRVTWCKNRWERICACERLSCCVKSTRRGYISEVMQFQLVLQFLHHWHFETAEKRQLSSVEENEHLQRHLKTGSNLVTHTHFPHLTMWIQLGHGNKCWVTSVRPVTFRRTLVGSIKLCSHHWHRNGQARSAALPLRRLWSIAQAPVDVIADLCAETASTERHVRALVELSVLYMRARGLRGGASRREGSWVMGLPDALWPPPTS